MSIITLYFVHNNNSHIKIQMISNSKFSDIIQRYYTQVGIEKEIPQFIYNNRILSPESDLTLDQLNIIDQARIEVSFDKNKKKSQY